MFLELPAHGADMASSSFHLVTKRSMSPPGGHITQTRLKRRPSESATTCLCSIASISVQSPPRVPLFLFLSLPLALSKKPPSAAHHRPQNINAQRKPLPRPSPPPARNAVIYTSEQKGSSKPYSKKKIERRGYAQSEQCQNRKKKKPHSREPSIRAGLHGKKLGWT